MAQKKISDLQLRSSFDSTCIIPVDDASQTWRTTGLQVRDFVLGAGNVGTTALAAGSVTSEKLAAGAAAALSVTTKTGAYTAVSADQVILADAIGGAFTIALPAAAANAGKLYRIKKIDTSTNAVTVDPNGAETIDGATTAVIGVQYQSVDIISTGTAWVSVKPVRSVHELKYDTRAGVGTTNTRIPQFTTNTVNTVRGTALLSPTNTPADGFFVTALAPCKVTMTFQASFTGTGEAFGITRNPSSGSRTTNIQSVTAAERVALSHSPNDTPQQATATVHLNTGDTLYPHHGNTVNLGAVGNWSILVHAESV